MGYYQRRHDLDWIRVLAFTILILFHTGMFFNTWDWHVKNDETYEWLNYIMIFINQWRMPVLFFVSGAAVWFAMEKYSVGRFYWERHKRLFIPLAFGMFVIIPPQVYFERLFGGQTYSFSEFYATVFNFVPYPEGNFTWHHLWYIPYIFAYSLLMIPVFRWLKTDRGRNWLGRCVRIFSKGSRIVWWFAALAVSEILLRPHWPHTANLIADWATFTTHLLIFCFGYVLAGQGEMWNRIESLRKKSLLLGIGATAVLYVFWYSPYEPSADVEGMFYVIYRTLRTLNIWAWILAALGFGRRYLSFKNAFLSYANEAVYPFYIVHQTITVIAGYFMVHWPLSPVIKFLILAVITFGGSALVYEFVRHIRILRPLFGLKMTVYRRQRVGTTAEVSASWGAE